MMADIEEKNWVTSKEILVKTDISRATLNNYIKMGILPRPAVRRIETDQKGSKQIGYFPEEVFERIATVKRLKKRGGSMEEIAKRFKDTSLSKTPPVAKLYPQKSTEAIDSSPAGSGTPDLSSRSLALTIDDMHIPAYLVNNKFEITWINQESESQIFNRDIRSIDRLESRNIFKLFFNNTFHNYLQNWKEIIAFHIRFMKPHFPISHINNIYSGISENEIGLLKTMYDETDVLPENFIKSYPVKFIANDGLMRSYKVYCLVFREGVFIVYVPEKKIADKIMDLLSQREKIINDLLKQRMPSMVSLSVLVADLQDSVKISAELLPGEYFQLINQIWDTLGSTFDKYKGISGKHSGDGMVYYFIRKPGSNYVMNAINCALEMKEKVKQLSSEWKLRKGWQNDIFLNIGINEGQEFFGAIRSASNIEFTALGDSINYAGRLSDFARYGSILTTKNLISTLDQEAINTFRFGIYRKEYDREIFIKNSFSRVIDLLDKENPKYSKFLDIATLPITEIL